MLTLNQIDEIKALQRQWYGPVEIAERLGINRKTASRYLRRNNFDHEISKKVVPISKLDSWKPEINSWLEEDRRNRYKQRHTAKRVYDRLKELHTDFDCSYSIVQRYVKEQKALSVKIVYATRRRKYEVFRRIQGPSRSKGFGQSWQKHQ